MSSLSYISRYRIIPVLIRQPLASTRLMLASAALILVGNAGRVTLELLTLSGRTWTYRLMGTTGVLELAALILFAWNIAATARNRRRTYRPDQPLTPNTRVQEAVNARPEIQDRLRELGVTMFDGAPFIAPSMTIGALALAWGMDPRRLIDELRAKPSMLTAPPAAGGSVRLLRRRPAAGPSRRRAS